MPHFFVGLENIRQLHITPYTLRRFDTDQLKEIMTINI